MTRLTRSRLLALGSDLSARDREMVQTVARLRLVSGKQLERLFFCDGARPETRARLARRTQARLVAAGVLGRLERRVGGVRAGSAGYVYALGPAGQRLVRLWRGDDRRSRPVYEPGGLFVRHVLAVSEAYVRLHEIERAGVLEVLGFEAEPACWRTFTGPGGGRAVLKPDAFVRLGTGAYEDRYFLEIDCGSEGRGALLRKCQTYLGYYRAGTEQTAHGVFPRVLWITTTERRARLLADVCRSLPREAGRLFAVTTEDDAAALLVGSLDPAAPGRAL
jgi:protein involved in plasmid replication-relaxation